MRIRQVLAAGAAAGLAAACLSSAAEAATVSGSFKGVGWRATNQIVGQGSTATGSGGGSPLYFPHMPQASGVVALVMDEGSAGAFICSGALLGDRRSIVTAGHCVSHGAGTDAPVKTTAYFYGGSDPDTVVPGSPDATAIEVSRYFVDPAYTGQVVDQDDIAVLRLAADAPAFATAYGLYTGGDLAGKTFDIAGYGGRSDGGGAVGADLDAGRLRVGENRYDFRFGDGDFQGFFDGFFGSAADDYSYVGDFDNGLAANDASCRLAAALGAGGAKYCNTGLGAREVGTAGGDSGGPQFIDGRIASVTSFGLTFGPAYGDFSPGLNGSWGELNGFVPISLHEDFIRQAMLPEPGAWALMILGFGLAGMSLRRRGALSRP